MEPQYDNMVGKPLLDILSKLPSKSLLRFRCVSKLWREYIDDSYFVSVHDKQVIEDPTPIMFYLNESGLEKTLCFRTIESDTITNKVLKVKNNPVFEFVDMKLLSGNSITRFVGSYNGLILIEIQDPETKDTRPTYTVIHPINKQCYVLPQLPLGSIRESCGLGFDSSTNTFKMVYVSLNPNYPSCGARRAHCTRVHVFGTNSWHKIRQVPFYRISGKAIFAHGCLHWLACYNQEDVARQIIWFDVKNKKFGLSKPPKIISQSSKRKHNNHTNDHVVNIDGHVGYFSNKTTEVWVLNHKNEWVLHCNLEDHDFPDGFIKVLGCLNKAGDILIKVTKWPMKEWFYIYNLNNRVIHEAHINGLDLEDGSETDMDLVMFPNSLCDIMTNSNLFKKRA